MFHRFTVYPTHNLVNVICLRNIMTSNKESIYKVPKSGRTFYRNGNDFKVDTYGKYSGYLQANVPVVSAEYAEDFAEFCKKNEAVFPLLYQSKPGEVGAGYLAEDADIRTDLPAYSMYKDGVCLPDPLRDLLSFSPWCNWVTFYLGCSFSFDDKLADLGFKSRHDIALCLTNIELKPAGPFQCNMIASVRPMPTELLSGAVEVTMNTCFAHGAPVHIGNPADIGLKYHDGNVLKCDITSGDTVVVKEGEVPCFWACGGTANVAIMEAKLPLAFTTYSNNMYVTDIPSDDMDSLYNSPTYGEPRVICTDVALQRYGVISEDVYSKLTCIEGVVSQDPGKRGIAGLRVLEDFHKICLDLSMRAKAVGILVGFPLFQGNPAEENDGIAGAIYLARALQAIDVDVYMIVDTWAEDLIDCFSKCKSKGFTHQNIPMIPMGKTNKGILEIIDDDNPITHLISIERPSPAEDGNHYTMNGIDISDKVGSMADVFRQAYSHPEVTTIGIGDGGNEIGMGKVKDKVKENVRNGGLIAADVPAEFLLTCGVSNWGGLAIAAGLYAVRSCPLHERYQRRGIGFPGVYEKTDFVFTPELDLKLHEWLQDLGFKDGVTGKSSDLTVDGLAYGDAHGPMLKQLIDIV